MTSHALLSASSSARWLSCQGSVALCKDIPETTSVFAEEGTAAHTLASWCLEQNVHPDHYKGEVIRIVNGKYMSADDMIDFFTAGKIIESDRSYEVTDEMVEHIQSYVEVVKDFTPEGATRFIEKRVDFSSYLFDLTKKPPMVEDPRTGLMVQGGHPSAFGTSDVIIMADDEIAIIDLKYGSGVQVDAEENSQLMLYALGAYSRFKLLGDFKRARMVIHQPRMNHLSEWDCSIEDLLAFGREAKVAAKNAMSFFEPDQQTFEISQRFKEFLNPSVKACQWCRAKHLCPALAAQNTALMTDDFVNLDDEEATLAQFSNAIEILPSTPISRLTTLMKGADLVELWIKSIREAVYSHLARGEKVKGFKLVRGREGHRQWSDKSKAETDLKIALGAKAYYPREIISPTDAEKALKKDKDSWADLQDYITRSDGKLSVAPIDDKREAVSVEAIEFEDLTISDGGLV